jgi:hypothetical protein
MNPPTIDEQIAAVENALKALLNGCMILDGPDAGDFVEPGMRREALSLRAAIANLERLNSHGAPEDDRPHY